MRLGVDVERVQEVLRQQRMTHVPLAPAALAGVLNLRGRVVPAIDLRRRLELSERDPNAAFVNVVVATPHGTVSLLADEIADVFSIDPARFEPSPGTVPDAARELVLGACKGDDELVLLLDVDRAVQLRAGPGLLQ